MNRTVIVAACLFGLVEGPWIAWTLKVAGHLLGAEWRAPTLDQVALLVVALTALALLVADARGLPERDHPSARGA
ncbi:hypothetical protein [Tropicimonas isoalkanivorans]|uniref:Uncharacterized protein n=1 Tax=Tropicimonas isoalkanivorans TaxID=441112 RepID=A0A1I1R448_9RHOB|nr:hypothetical protein [Tropicimonas isoalkanivorans]SFD28977.1 hypothetical protein SAMN04488094_12714 [Tropicimonas isoalkanivorans]